MVSTPLILGMTQDPLARTRKQRVPGRRVYHLLGGPESLSLARPICDPWRLSILAARVRIRGRPALPLWDSPTRPRTRASAIPEIYDHLPTSCAWLLYAHEPIIIIDIS